MICIPYDETITADECRKWCNLTSCGLTTTCKGCSMGGQVNIDNMEVKKKCFKCGEFKPLGEYSMDVKNKDGKRHVCRQCDKERTRVRKADKVTEQVQAYTPQVKTVAMVLKDQEQAKVIKLANQHWYYIEELLEAHGESPEMIKKIGFHYRSAFVHGHKHATEEAIA